MAVRWPDLCWLGLYGVKSQIFLVFSVECCQYSDSLMQMETGEFFVEILETMG